MRLLLCLLIVSGVWLLNAQTDDEIDLGKYIIEGDSGVLTDTTAVFRGLSPFWEIGQLKLFQYQPRFSIFLPDEDQLESDDDFLMEIRGGENSFKQGRLGFHDRRYDLFNFSASYRELKHTENWQEREADFFWMLRKGAVKVDPGLYYSEYSMSDWRDSEIKSAFLRFESSDLELGSKLNLEKFFLSGEYDLLEYQDYQTDLSETDDLESDFRGEIEFSYRKMFTEIRSVVIREAASGSMRLGFKNISFMQKAGLWLAVDKNSFWPALVLNGYWKLGSRVYLFYENEPEFRIENHREMSVRNPVSILEDEVINEFVPLNSRIMLDVNGVVPFSLSYGISTHFNHAVVSFDEQVTEQLIFWERVNLLWQKVGLAFSYRTGKISLNQNFSYNRYDLYEKIDDLDYRLLAEDIRYLPKLRSVTELRYSPDNFDCSVNLEYQEGRYNSQGLEFPSAFLLDLSITFKIFSFLDIIAGGYNLLDVEYQTYDFSPMLKRRLEAGFSMSF
ncbi:MAG: TonB-dependent receptor [Candidatus Cloacimonetes bacterium]|nr:TonB-dependent receptor [Candidatus Cloacimonadota bacterium]